MRRRRAGGLLVDLRGLGLDLLSLSLDLLGLCLDFLGLGLERLSAELCVLRVAHLFDVEHGLGRRDGVGQAFRIWTFGVELGRLGEELAVLEIIVDFPVEFLDLEEEVERLFE